ncbi:hypothetical protein [Sporosarcina sp. Te-1]|uniref:hypothetical protein n=1 Tax=Sporosarcina sp. Te-1 TaxID=2818390 RepID=UPI001A9F68F1|nr:hypothetical protein [Sporosarcina sp. Te-1]QTD43079.1 hypothetical protein J3U78_10230 [Sporosarcina sp. Te-1]
MYDPTIFENIKVALENHIYDLDTVERRIVITNRTDQMDFAILSRRFGIEFMHLDSRALKAEIILSTTLRDLAGEILEMKGEVPGCSLTLRFFSQLQTAAVPYKEIGQVLYAIWEQDIDVTQTISSVLGEEPVKFMYTIEAAFHTRINEDHMQEIGNFLVHVLRTMEALGRIIEGIQE